MAVAKITNEVKLAIERKTAKTLPDQPTARGYSAETIRNTLYRWLSDNTNSLFAELDRIVDETNADIANVTAGTTNITYNNAVSGLTAITIKAAIDELDSIIDNILSGNTNIAYSNSVSGMIATTLKAAIDELDNEIDNIKSGVTIVKESDIATKDEDGNNIKSTYEKVANKRTSWQATPTNTAFPSEKLAKDSLDLKTDKATTILGIDLANDIARAEFVAALGNATALLSGLLSPEDYSLLVTLRAMLGEEADVDTFVNKFNEILAIFSNYPEGADLVTVLAGKVDKVSGKELSSNDYTDADQAKVSHLPDNIITFMGDYYTKAQVDTLLDQLTTAYGLTETAIEELAHNGTILLSSLTTYDYITLYLKHTDTHFIFDGKLIDPAVFANNGDMIQLNAWENGVQQSYGKLTYDGTTWLTFTASDTLDTLVIKGYKKDVVTGLLVEEEFTGTNHLDEETNVHDSLVALDTQIKANADSVTDLEDGTTPAKKAEQDADGNVITTTYETIANVTAVKVDVSEHEQRIDTLEETLRKSQNGGDSSTATGTDIISLPKDVVKAPLKVQVDGMVLKAEQLVTNGDFSDGTTGWSLSQATATFTDGIVEISSNGADAVPFIYKNFTFTADVKWYLATRARTLSSGDLQLYISASGSTLIKGTQTSPVQNQWYNISVVSSDTTARTDLRIVSQKSSPTNGAKHQVDYAYAFNISALITAKQYSPLYNKTFDTMSDAEIKAQMDLWVTNGTLPHDGIQAVNMNKRLRATGKNLLKNVEAGTIISGIETTHTNYIRNDEPIKIDYNKNYVVSHSGSALAIAIYYYDINNTYVSLQTGNSPLQLIIPNNIYYVRFRFGGSDSNQNELLLRNYQLELGSTATTYEPYVSTEMFLQANAEGYRVPNGTKDTIEIRDGKAYYVKRVQKYTLQASDITTLENLTTVQRVRLNRPIDYKYYSTNPSVVGSEVIGDYIEDTFTTSDLVANIGKYSNFGSTAYTALIITAGTYVSLAEAQSALAGTVIIYQLATPVTTEISSAGLLNGYPSGTIYVDDVMNVACQYGTSAQVADTNYPITSLLQIRKMNGVETELSLSGATIAGDGLSFTHSGLTAGDIVYFEYAYGTNSIKGLTTVTYYDNPLIVVDSVTSTVYKLVPSVASGVLTWTPTAI